MGYLRVSAASVLVLCGGIASAQNTPPNDRDLDIQLFEPAIGSHSYLTISGADIMGASQFQLGVGMNYMTHPFTVYTVDEQHGNMLVPRSDVVSSIVSGYLMGAYGIKDKIQLGILLPITMVMEGDGLDLATGMPQAGGLSVSGLGDARLELVWRFYQKGRVSLAAIPAVTVPSAVSLGSKDSDFLGEGLPSFRPRFAAEWASADGKFSVAGNLGAILHAPRTLYSSNVGQELTYGVAAAYHLNARIDIMAELFGRQGFTSDLYINPLEGDLAVRIHVTPAFTFVGGGGAGIVHGVGAPGLRVFAGLSFAPDFRDSDGDGIDNMHDRCPYEAEDKDGFQDADGCPDPDNDGDGIPDAQDKCPNEAEDLDGFQDEDGCPDLDNDKDGIPDAKDACPNDPEDHLPPHPDDGCPASKFDTDGDGIMDDKDKCPNDPEDMDGFEDADGCPDPDNDHDGILDADDKCPNEPEDKDGFQDADGCPDPDNDHDGIPDVADKCPNEPETVNGYQDSDGCPDTGGRVLATLSGNVFQLAQPVGYDGTAVGKRSTGVLDQAALIMKGHDEVKKWRVVVAAEKQATEDKQRAMSQARADAVKAYLVDRGVPASRIEAIGAVSDSPTTAIVATERAGGEPPPPDQPPPDDSGQTIEIQ